ncbi:MAG: N-acetylneuraminate synthase family protein [Deltaproteobacteria bacterium]|nr:N-acetylneuraminate synthase family protein [Deltaproteobacteria bacterium]MBK8238265.1 N-acetylneuraminate synthase family protein [Deltaproteobacteria bacterium]MBP7291074.1 N-acetylneuraminate synthase family protein [Nannocystaceae bacterium]
MHTGPDAVPLVIAEIGCNHKGDFALAKELVQTAAQFCRVDAVKFQKRTPRELLSPEQYDAPHPDPAHAYGRTYGEHREFLELDVDQHAELKTLCESLGIDYSSSAWDLTSAKEIASLQPSWIKIPSACNTDYAMLGWLCEHYAGGLHVSLGMTTKPEERALMELLEAHGRLGDTVLYSCTSGYPVAMEDLCLLEISRLADDYGDRVAAIGFSGHHLGIAADIAAITLGAAWVERHFTLDRTWKGTDHAASLEPDGMRRLCRDVRNVAGALRFRDEEILEVERAARSKLKHVARPRLIKAA